MKAKFTLLLSFTFLYLYSNSQNTLILQPDQNNSQNAVIWDYDPTSPNPYNNLFQGSAWTQSGTPKNYRSLLQFDLSSIPQNAIINSAYLNLYGFVGPNDGHSTLSGSNASILLKITSPWNENYVSWNLQPSTSTDNAVFLSSSIYAGQNYLNIDIQEMVQFWVANPDSNFGVLYKLIDESYYRRMSFHSPASSDPLKRPKLTIDYSLLSNTDEFSDMISFNIYPNPVSTKLFFSYPSNVKAKEVMIYNITGEIIYQSSDEGLEFFDFTDLPSGFYFVHLNLADQLINQKIIKLKE